MIENYVINHTLRIYLSSEIIEGFSWHFSFISSTSFKITSLTNITLLSLYRLDLKNVNMIIDFKFF